MSRFGINSIFIFFGVSFLSIAKDPYEDFYSEGKNEYENSKLQEEAQKQLIKRKKKEIRVYFVNLSLCFRVYICYPLKTDIQRIFEYPNWTDTKFWISG